MNIELTDAEATLLREVLTNKLNDLSVEIRHTDTPHFKTGLVQRRDSLKDVRDRLTAPVPTS